MPSNAKTADFRPPASSPSHARVATLRERPSRDRTSACRGLATGAGTSPAAPTEGTTSAKGLVGVDHVGGDLKAGLIRGCSLCTAGDALGHGYWLDAQFISQVQESSAAGGASGIKARFTHPSLSGDGLGSFLGRMKNCSVATGELAAAPAKCIGDLHMSPMAHKSPDGDLAEYVMGLAESDPKAFAMSIVFEHDFDAEVELLLANGAEWDEDDYGDFINLKNFKSPDPGNVNNYPHARLKKLNAADVVDDPAANPDGLFHREQQFAQEADAVASFALGLTDQAPVASALDIDPQRTRGFVSRFLNAHNLKIVSKETPMAAETPAQTPAPEQPAAETPKPETPAAPPAAETPAATPPPQTPVETPAADKPQLAAASDGRAECKRFIAAFGANGATWFSEGLSLEAAQAKHAEALAAENASLKGRLAAAAGKLGEPTPVSFNPDTTGDKTAKVARYAGKLSSGLAAFASGIKLPEAPAAKK